MTTPLSQMPKPDADQYQDRRKLFMVPAIIFPADGSDDAQRLQESYWNEVRDHIGNLERSLGQVAHIYHETVFADGEEGMTLVNGLNPKAGPFIQAMCQSSAKLEATEDRNLVEESSDWQRCLSIGLMSEKVRTLALESFQETTAKRYEHVAKTIDETLNEGEVGALFAGEDHRIQFPSDIQVFYVAPPSLDALKRWVNDQMRMPPPPPGPDEPPETEEEAGAESPEGAG